MNVGNMFNGFLRLGKHSNYLLGRMRALIDAHSKALENFKTDDCDSPYPNAEGGWTFPAGVGGGSGFEVFGTRGLFKGAELIGWEKASASSEWTQMSIAEAVSYNPTRLWTEFVDGVDAYPWKALRPTWDYVRAYKES